MPEEESVEVRYLRENLARMQTEFDRHREVTRQEHQQMKRELKELREEQTRRLKTGIYVLGGITLSLIGAIAQILGWLENRPH